MFTRIVLLSLACLLASAVNAAHVGCQIGGYLLDYSSHDFFRRAEGDIPPPDLYPDGPGLYGWSQFVAFWEPIENAVNPPLSGNFGFIGWAPSVQFGQPCYVETTHIIMKVADYNKLIGAWQKIRDPFAP